jgi:hypothetical protein
MREIQVRGTTFITDEEFTSRDDHVRRFRAHRSGPLRPPLRPLYLKLYPEPSLSSTFRNAVLVGHAGLVHCRIRQTLSNGDLVIMPFYPTTFEDLKHSGLPTLQACLQTMARLVLSVHFLHRNRIAHTRISARYVLVEFRNGVIGRSALAGLSRCQEFDPRCYQRQVQDDIRALSNCFREMVPDCSWTPEFLELVRAMDGAISLDAVISHPLFQTFIAEGTIDAILGDPGSDIQFVGRIPHRRDRTVWHLGPCLGEPGMYVKVVRAWCEAEGNSHVYALKIVSHCLQDLTQYQMSLHLEEKLSSLNDELVLPLARFAPRREINNLLEELDVTVVVYELYAADLRSWVQDQEIHDFETILDLIKQMAQRVIFLHSYARVHNSIHLDNFLVQPVEGRGVQVRLSGLSRLQALEECNSRGFLPFPARAGEETSYMAPELIETGECNLATDMFALGRCFESLLQRCETMVPHDMIVIQEQLLDQNPATRWTSHELYESPLIGRKFQHGIPNSAFIEDVQMFAVDYTCLPNV